MCWTRWAQPFGAIGNFLTFPHKSFWVPFGFVCLEIINNQWFSVGCSKNQQDKSVQQNVIVTCDDELTIVRGEMDSINDRRCSCFFSRIAWIYYEYELSIFYVQPITGKSVDFSSRENCSRAPRFSTWRKNQLPDNGPKINFFIETRPTIRTNQNWSTQIFAWLS